MCRDALELSRDDYYRALPISKEKNLELYLKKEPNCGFGDNCFDVGLTAQQANMDIQLVFSEYKVVTYMCQ